MIISNTTQSNSRNSAIHTILTGSNSIIYSLHKYKRGSLKNKNCIKNEDEFV